MKVKVESSLGRFLKNYGEYLDGKRGYPDICEIVEQDYLSYRVYRTETDERGNELTYIGLSDAEREKLTVRNWRGWPEERVPLPEARVVRSGR